MARWQHPSPHPVHGPLFKVLSADGAAHYSGAQWDTTKVPGEWMKCASGALVPCVNGVHVCREQDLVYWIRVGAAIFPVETKGRVIVHDESKLVSRRARAVGPALPTWNKRTQRLFAADCAERVLPLFEREYPDDRRPRTAIEVSRRLANGDAAATELAAARAAARAAAAEHGSSPTGHPAGAAADAAADAAAGLRRGLRRMLRRSAAAHAAASAAASARTAAGAAETRWQTQRLLQYIYGEIE